MSKQSARLVLLTLSVLFVMSSAWSAQVALPSTPQQDAVAAAIVDNSDVFPAGSTVTSVTVSGSTADVDLDCPEKPDGDAQADGMVAAIVNALSEWPEITATNVFVGGKALSEVIPGSGALDETAVGTALSPLMTAEMAAVMAPYGNLVGKKIALHPSHGSYWHQGYGQWFRAMRTLCGPNPATKPAGWQGSYYTPSNYYYNTRGYKWGSFYEDDMSPETIRFMRDYLINDGASVYVSRNLDKNSGNFDFNYYGYPNCSFPLPLWQVAAKYNLQNRGDIPEWVWNEKKLYYDSDKDIRARPYFANYVGADVSFSLHSNAVGGTPSGTGTETYWYTAQYENKVPGLREDAIRFAGCMNSGAVGAIRSYFEDYGVDAYGPLFTQKGPRPPEWTPAWNYTKYTGWRDRGVKTTNFGEIREAKMPSALCELAFHDAWHFWPDNLFLQDQIFRATAAWGFYEGMCNYFGTVPKPRLDATSDWVTFPTAVRPGQSFTGTVTMKNEGMAWCWGDKWVSGLYSPYSPWKLAAAPGDQFAPGAKISLPQGAVVTSNDSCTFNVTLTAPLTEGTYTTAWQMLRDDSKGGAFGEVAAAQIKVDATAPLIEIASPVAGSYTRLQSINISFSATDDTSVASLTAAYDGAPVASGTTIDLFSSALGTHSLVVNAVDDLDNTNSDIRSFAVVVTLDSLIATVDKLYALGQIDSEGIKSALCVKAAKYEMDGGNIMSVENYLKEFKNQVSAQSGRHITTAAADLLLGDASYVETHLTD